MKHSGFQRRFLIIVCVCYATLANANAEIRSKRFTQNSAILKALTLDNEQLHHKEQQQQQLHNNYINRGTRFVSRYDPASPDTPSDNEDVDEILPEAILHPSSWYSAIHSSVQYPLTHFYMGRQDEEKGKRFFDSLGGSEVHGFKRSALGRLGFNPENTDIMEMVPYPVNPYNGDLVDTSRTWQDTDSIEKAEDENQQPFVGSEVQYSKPLIHKRALDSLGGFQVHGWKREAGKRSLDSLGGFQVHGWKRWQNEAEKRSLDSLGGFQVHGWKKRAVDSVDKLHISKPESTARQIIKSGGKLSNVAEEKVDKLQESKEVDQSKGSSKVVGKLVEHKLVEQKLVDGSNFGVNDSDLDKNGNYPNFGKRALDSLGDFQVHGWKRDEEKRALDSLGDFHVHGWKRDEGKRALDSLGDFQVHGWKRDEEKRALDSLGDFHVHGWKRDEGKRALDSLGDFQVHGWKRDEGKRALDSLGDFHVHGWKRDEGKRALDSLGDFQVHGWKRDEGKRALDSLGDFQVHGWKRDEAKRALDSLGDFQVHGWKRDEGKRALDSLGDFQVHGWKRDEGKRALDSLGDFHVHGWKRDEGKRALDSLGDFHVHGWKRDEEKRALDSLGDFQVHGWKRDARAIEKRHT